MGLDRDSASAHRMPRWVKIFGIVGLHLVLLIVILHLTGHGLGGHTPVLNR